MQSSGSGSHVCVMFRVDPFAEFAGFWGQSDPRLAIRRACAEIVDDLGLTTALPRPLAPVTARLGASVVRRPGHEGWVRLTRDGAVIGIGNQDSWRRSRWTLAHEIGHLLVLHGLQGHAPAVRALHERDAYKPLETLCDIAAQELLCPPVAMRSFVEGSFAPERLREAYDCFLISWRAVLARWSTDFPHASASIWNRGDDCWHVSRQIGGWRMHEFPHGISSDAFDDAGLFWDADHRGSSAGLLSYTWDDVDHQYAALAAKMPATRAVRALPLWESRRIIDEPVDPRSLVILLVDPLFAPDLLLPIK